MTPSEPQRKPVWCVEHHELSWLYSDGSLGCWYCLTVETSCHCTPGEPIVTRREAQGILLIPELTPTVVQNALDEAWLESNDAHELARPPDLGRHLFDALRDYLAVESGGINVELLARALITGTDPTGLDPLLEPESARRYAEVIADHYTRLSESSPAEEGAQ